MVTKHLRCNNCQLPVDPANIDTQRELASCGNCGRLMDLRRVRSAAPEVPDTSGKARARAPVQLPAGMSLTTAAEVIIRRRWLRGKHWFLLVLFAAAAAYVGHLWSTAGASAWLVIGTL